LDAYKLKQSRNIRHNRLWVTKVKLVGMNKMFDYAEFQVPMPGTELIMIHAHNQHHRGAKGTLWRSRSSAWITRENQRVSNNCYECRRGRALAKKQKLANLPRERIMKRNLSDSSNNTQLRRSGRPLIA
jgi:hypothetical protein